MTMMMKTMMMITNVEKRKQTMKITLGLTMKIVVRNQALLGVVLQNVKRQKERKGVKEKTRIL